MTKKLASTLFLAWMLLIWAGTPAAAQPLLSRPVVYCEKDHVCLDFYLKNALGSEMVASIQNGIPALLTYRVDVWRDRANWYDQIVRSHTYSYRISFDNWDTLYCIEGTSSTKQEVGRAENVGELIHLVCTQKCVPACPMSLLDSISRYYVTISAEIQSLGAERVKEIESWLGGREEKQAGGGGLLGMVVGMFTSKSERAEAKSASFGANGLLRR